MKLELTTKEKEFISQYIDTALWAGNGTDYGLDEDCKREAIIDCLAFYSRVCCYLTEENRTQAAHDFYLSRNGLGSGFWDKAPAYTYSDDLLTLIGNYADKFQAIAESFGETHYYDTEGNTL
tara:strand:- start:1528 stop:1893 length:366 start_codon:yes stop_codon:yes gene_type:complete